jgi:hypothetical protein
MNLSADAGAAAEHLYISLPLRKDVVLPAQTSNQIAGYFISGQLIVEKSSRQRPAAVEDRAVPGHWEGDLLSGSKNSYIATLVERHTRYVMLVKVANKDTQTVVSALIKQAKKLPSELYRSLTWDRGKELTDHRRFTLTTNIDVYFCDPQSPWQRGSNENTNGLLRRYFPKGTDLSVHSQANLNKVARQLNERPRETLQFETPAERFNACVASTGSAGKENRTALVRNRKRGFGTTRALTKKLPLATSGSFLFVVLRVFAGLFRPCGTHETSQQTS